MACRSCGSEMLVTMRGELTASFTTVRGAKLAPLYVCQTILACPNCGFTELQIPPAQLKQLVKDTAAGKSESAGHQS